MSGEEEALPTTIEYSENSGFVPRANNISRPLEHGDKFVRREDVEALILQNLEEIEERFHNGDKAISGILDKPDLVTEVLETVEEELLDEVQSE